MRILVVEDEMLVAMDLEMQLERRGHCVAGPVASVAAALALLEHTVDAAILDINLGDETTLPLADALLEMQIPYAFASGYEMATLPEAHRAAPRLVKPMQAARLDRVVAELAAAAGQKAP